MSERTPPLRRRSIYAIAGGVIACVGVVGIAVAQDMSGISIEEIHRRMNEYSKEAGDVVNDVKNKHDIEQEKVKPVVDDALAKIGTADLGGIENIDPLALKNYVDGLQKDGPQGDASHVGLVAFVSLSMPDEALRKVILDMSKAGGFVVFRGFPNNNVMQFKNRLSTVLGDGSNIRNVGIDPKLFEAFNVEAVPTFVAYQGNLNLCKQLECKSTPPEHDVLQGNVPLDYALRTFADGNGPGATVSRKALKQLEAR